MPQGAGRGLNLAIKCPDRRHCSKELKWVHYPTFNVYGNVCYGEDAFGGENVYFDLAVLERTYEGVKCCPDCATPIMDDYRIRKIAFLDCAFRVSHLFKGRPMSTDKIVASGDQIWYEYEVNLPSSTPYFYIKIFDHNEANL